MLILVNKKVKKYYKIDLEDLPFGVFTPEAWKSGIHKKVFMYEQDYIANLNTQPELININHVKCFTTFDYEKEYKNKYGCEYMNGAKTKVVFYDNSTIFVTETIEEISSKIGVV